MPVVAEAPSLSPALGALIFAGGSGLEDPTGAESPQLRFMGSGALAMALSWTEGMDDAAASIG